MIENSLLQASLQIVTAVLLTVSGFVIKNIVADIRELRSELWNHVSNTEIHSTK